MKVSDELVTSTPSFHQFDPRSVPYQARVVQDMESFDYSLGVHEILLSGSVGCLRESTPILTACGEVPICDIEKSDYLLSFDHSRSRYVLQSGSDAFPKGKDYLYRVIHERGEFVGSCNHQIATSHGRYLSLGSLYAGASVHLASFDQALKYPSDDQKWFLLNVLRYSQIFLNFLDHCAKRIRLYDQQLPWDLETVLACFPLQADVRGFDQFSYLNKCVHKDDSLVPELKLDRTSGLCGLLSKRDFVNLLASMLEDEVNAYSSSISCGQTLPCTQPLLLSRTRDVHPRVLLSLIRRISTSLANLTMYYPTEKTFSRVLSVEKLPRKEWYWDLQVPNTNNYLACGSIHHNSAKSILAAHQGVKHCLRYPNARLGLFRKALPDLRDTIYTKICEHLSGTVLADGTELIEGKHYFLKDTTCYVRFINGSEIISRSWSDKKYKKLGSIELSAGIVEELTENENEDETAIKYIRMRVGRLAHVPQSWIMYCTNPDGTSHFAYKYFDIGNKQRRPEPSKPQ